MLFTFATQHIYLNSVSKKKLYTRHLLLIDLSQNRWEAFILTACLAINEAIQLIPLMEALVYKTCEEAIARLLINTPSHVEFAFLKINPAELNQLTLDQG